MGWSHRQEAIHCPLTIDKERFHTAHLGRKTKIPEERGILAVCLACFSVQRGARTARGTGAFFHMAPSLQPDCPARKSSSLLKGENWSVPCDFAAEEGPSHCCCGTAWGMALGAEPSRLQKACSPTPPAQPQDPTGDGTCCHPILQHPHWPNHLLRLCAVLAITARS